MGKHAGVRDCPCSAPQHALPHSRQVWVPAQSLVSLESFWDDVLYQQGEKGHRSPYTVCGGLGLGDGGGVVEEGARSLSKQRLQLVLPQSGA